jgi:hydroxyacylglutathione hydrolase
VDRTVKGGDCIRLGSYDIDIIDTPGHTLGHISYYLPAARTAFVADTLFAVGCGRVIEGTMAMMWDSLAKLMALPGDTAIYCGHEYTEANIRFAMTIEPDNVALVARAAEVKALRAAGQATLPTTIAREKETNPFLRAREPGIRARLGMKDASDAAVFGEIRRRKDSFK